MRATQLTHIGIDQSPMMTCPLHENPRQVKQRHHGEDHPSHKKKRFASMGRHPKFLTHDSTLKGSRFSIFCRMTGPKDGHCERLDMSG